MSSSKTNSPTVGRPRASQKETSGDSRRDILTAAGKLFRAKGFGGASLRAIGEEAGLRKASLYYYFKSKDDILRAMIEGVMADPLALVEKFKANGSDPGPQLWAYLYVDTRQLCLAPYDYSWMLTTAETRGPQYDYFWDDRNNLLAWIIDAISRGIESGAFGDTDVDTAARAVLSLDEFAVSWMPGSGKSPHQIAEFVADFALKGLLSDPHDLTDMRAQGQQIVKELS